MDDPGSGWPIRGADDNRAELGNKEIYKVNVISDRNSLRPFQVTELHMFFHVRDVPQPTTEE